MRMDRHGVTFTSGWEGFVPYPYDDKAKLVNGRPPEWQGGPVTGTITIGFGHTNAGRDPLNIKPGQRVTRDQALDILAHDVAGAEDAVNALVKVPLTQGQFNALTDLTFNFGAGNLKKSVLLARLNRGDYAGARAAFDLYVKSKGETMKGLVRRRDAEQALWDERPAEAKIPHQDEEFEVTPKEIDHPAPPKTLAQSNTIKGVATTGVAAAPPIAGAVIKAANDTPGDAAAPTVTETITHVVDRAGEIVNTVKTVHESLPQMPEGFWAKFAHLATDPIVMACFGVVVLSGLAFIAFERWRKLHYEGA